MDARIEMLYEELRQTEQEIVTSLGLGYHDRWLTAIFEEELADIQATLTKMENGAYGKCEISGELLPDEILKWVPTIKSVHDYKKLASYYRKPLYSRH